jgi:hypothetical protein
MQIYEQQKEICECWSWPKWDPNLELTHTHQLGVEEEHNKHIKWSWNCSYTLYSKMLT